MVCILLLIFVNLLPLGILIFVIGRFLRLCLMLLGCTFALWTWEADVFRHGRFGDLIDGMGSTMFTAPPTGSFANMTMEECPHEKMKKTWKIFNTAIWISFEISLKFHSSSKSMVD